MKYLICQDWENTANNHAGMKHLCNLLKDKFYNEYHVVVLKEIKSTTPTFFNRLKNKILFKIVIPLRNICVALNIVWKLKDGDEVFLLEYMEKLSPQIYFATIIKKCKPQVKIAGLVHLTPHALNDFFTDREIKRWSAPLDTFITLGSSLSKYLVNKGISLSKIKTSYHYVDLDYYKKPEVQDVANWKANVIVMGNQRRNYEVLVKIIESNPEVSFTICKGMSNIDYLFSALDNVKLVGFVKEDVLRKLMSEADISLNIMYDTVGSNVITTSMAMGLAIVTSDVGSIRDYCNENEAIFCNNEDVDSFSMAIAQLSQNRERLLKMKRAAILKAHNFKVEIFHDSLKFKKEE